MGQAVSTLSNERRLSPKPLKTRYDPLNKTRDTGAFQGFANLY